MDGSKAVEFDILLLYLVRITMGYSHWAGFGFNFSLTERCSIRRIELSYLCPSHCISLIFLILRTNGMRGKVDICDWEGEIKRYFDFFSLGWSTLILQSRIIATLDVERILRIDDIKIELLQVSLWYFSFQWVRIATPEYGVFKMLICSGLSLLHIPLPRTPSQVWCSHHNLEAPRVFLACSWQSNKIFIISLIRQMIPIACILKTWINPLSLMIKVKNSNACLSWNCCTDIDLELFIFISFTFFLLKNYNSDEIIIWIICAFFIYVNCWCLKLPEYFCIFCWPLHIAHLVRLLFLLCSGKLCRPYPRHQNWSREGNIQGNDFTIIESNLKNCCLQ